MGSIPRHIVPRYDATLGQIVRRQFDGDGVTGENPDIVLAHFAGNMRGHHMTVFEFDAKRRIGQRLGDDALHLNGFFFGQGFPVSEL